MTSNTITPQYRLNFIPFLLISVILHLVIVFIFVLVIEKPTQFNPVNTTLIVYLNEYPTKIKPKSQISPSAKTEHLEKKIPNQKEKSTDLRQKSLNAARELAKQPEFWQELQQKNTLIPNYRNDLFTTNKNVTKTTIESFNNLSTGETYIVFRYPSGKTICAKMREPDPFDNFDLGSWMIVLNGCK